MSKVKINNKHAKRSTKTSSMRAARQDPELAGDSTVIELMERSGDRDLMTTIKILHEEWALNQGYRDKRQAPSIKRQAASLKLQAASDKLQDLVSFIKFHAARGEGLY